MFTGIVQAVGTLKGKSLSAQGDMTLTIATGQMAMADVQLGDSIAVNGVCLTVVSLTAGGFTADVSNESLKHTGFGQMSVGTQVNLEKALTLATPLGGHLVSGHVDGLGEILSIKRDARSVRIQVSLGQNLARYVASKGSITVDGTSLTVTEVEGDRFHLNIVPHTADQTIISQYQVGHQVHLEVDLIARYLERLLQFQEGQSASSDTGLTLGKLAQAGFLTNR